MSSAAGFAPLELCRKLLNEAARKLRIPQITVPFRLHERLWPIKYIIFLTLFAVSLGSVELAFRGVEVEPFKTVISMKFAREWPFVLFALSLLILGLFIERFYCRYLCPLGAALAIPARLHMFRWLKRRHQCGKECKICEIHCTVQAIHPNGEINPNECIHCLNCQRYYNDKTMCPPLIVREKRRLKRAAVAAATRTGRDGRMTQLLTRRRFLTIAAAGVAAATTTLPGAARGTTRWRGTALGADAEMAFSGPDRAHAEETISSCLGELERLEQIFSLYRPAVRTVAVEPERTHALPLPATCWR